jgi:hypothetical protein
MGKWAAKRVSFESLELNRMDLDDYTHKSQAWIHAQRHTRKDEDELR